MTDESKTAFDTWRETSRNWDPWQVWQAAVAWSRVQGVVVGTVEDRLKDDSDVIEVTKVHYHALKARLHSKTQLAEGLAKRLEERANKVTPISERPCTCHPDDNPPRPCPRKYALSECRAAAAPEPAGAKGGEDDLVGMTIEGWTRRCIARSTRCCASNARQNTRRPPTNLYGSRPAI